jgi:hypothetical protein
MLFFAISDDLCKLLLAETQASKDFKQGHASTTTELKEVDELVLKLQSTQDAIRDECVRKVIAHLLCVPRSFLTFACCV